MPPSNSAGRASSQKPIVPAIPLSLTRPKAKPKPKPRIDSLHRPEPVPTVEGGKDLAQHETTQERDEHSDPTVNGHGATANPVEDAAPKANSQPDTAPEANSQSDAAPGAESQPDNGIPHSPAAPVSSVQDLPDAQSAAPSRQPTSGPDLRAIRTELPPAFVPSAERHTPQSTTSSSRSRPPNFNSSGHAIRPSAGSIVFGSMDSQTSSPAPPRSDGSAFTPPPPVNAGVQSSPSYGAVDHANHADPRMFRPHPPGIPPPAAQWHPRHGHSYSHQPPSNQHHGLVHMHNSSRDSIHPTGPQYTNGVTGPPRSPAVLGPMRQPPFAHSSHPASQYPHPDVLASQENAEAIRAHVYGQFGKGVLADCHLHITEAGQEEERHLNGHLIMMSRSEPLVSLIQASRHQGTGQASVHIPLSGQYLRIAGFLDAIQYLHGGPVLSCEPPRPAVSAGEQIAENLARMNLALQHIAVGSWLKLPAFAERGLEVASFMLRWDTVAEALAFTLEGGLSPIWAIEDGSEDKMSSSSSDDSLNGHDQFGTPAHEPYSTTLLQRIVGFAIHMFPPNFYLDTSVPDLASCPRLPSFSTGHNSLQSRSDPRLTQIRFGDAPAEELQRPSFATTTISSVLLSLPLPLLKCILEHFDLANRLGPDTVGSIMRQVVAEREARRLKALRAHEAGLLVGSPDAVAVQNLLWEESVEASPQHRAGLRLARRRRGIDTPPSSTAASEQMRS